MNDIKANSYIYGIKIDNKLVYIGKTSRPIEQRMTEHALLNAHNEDLEKAMNENDYEMVILYESHHVISDEELCQIERALIENIKPKYNILGVTKPYEFYAKKGDYIKNGIKRHYQGLCEQEADAILELNPFLEEEYYYGPIYKFWSKPKEKEAWVKIFGEPNLLTDSQWKNYGEYGFCVKSPIILDKQDKERPLTYKEMIGKDKIPEGERYYLPGLYVFYWKKDLEETIRELLIAFGEARCKDINDIHAYINAYDFYEEAEELHKISKDYDDLEKRMSYVVQPIISDQKDGKLMIGPNRQRFLD